MTPDQITLLRKILLAILNKDLTRIHTFYPKNYLKSKIQNARWDCADKIRKALALLPCPTCEQAHTASCPNCDDSGRVPTFDQASGLADADPCPDCK